ERGGAGCRHQHQPALAATRSAASREAARSTRPRRPRATAATGCRRVPTPPSTTGSAPRGPTREATDERVEVRMEPQETEPFASTQEQGGAAEPLRTLIDRLEADERWDPLADTLDDLGRPLAEGPSGPLMRGEWLGHALHPLMTDIPIGCWSSASVLDLIGGRAARPAARRLVGLGVLAALPTAATGLVELASVEDRRLRRVGAVHAS